MKVVMSPDYTGTNPYQRNLADALESQGADVDFIDRCGPLLPLTVFQKTERPDVLHLHWLHGFLLGRNAGFTLLKSSIFLIQLLVLRALGVRIVWTAHNILEHDPRNPRLERLYKHFLVRIVDAVIVHCDDAAQTIQQSYRLPDRYAEQMYVVPHGHYIDNYKNDMSRVEARDEFGFDDEFVYLYFGRICEYKNVTNLIEAFDGLNDPDARLLVVGNPETEEMESRITTAAIDDTRITTVLQFIPEEQIQLYMNAADVVVLPFSEILTSGSTILAMSFSNPVIVPDAGCVSSLIPPNGGFTYSDEGVDTLQTVMENVAESDLEQVRRANYQAAQARGWESIARLSINAYGRDRFDCERTSRRVRTNKAG